LLILSHILDTCTVHSINKVSLTIERT